MTTRSWLIGAFCALGLAAAASAQTTMKINVSAAQNSHHGVGIDVFAKEVEQRTNGRYRFQTFYNGALGGERESIEAVQLGTQEMTFCTSGAIPNFVPETKIVDVPFLFRVAWEQEAPPAAGKRLADAAQEHGAHGHRQQQKQQHQPHAQGMARAAPPGWPHGLAHGNSRGRASV